MAAAGWTLQNGFMVSLSPGGQLMRVCRLAASEWGNSPHHPSSQRGAGGGVVRTGEGAVGGVEGGHIPHYVPASRELSLIF